MLKLGFTKMRNVLWIRLIQLLFLQIPQIEYLFGAGASNQVAYESGAQKIGEELRFGFLIAWNSKDYNLRASKYFLPRFTKIQHYQNIYAIASVSDKQSYDVIIKADNYGGRSKLSVFSAYSQKTLFVMRDYGLLGKDEGVAIYNAFRPGSDLYKQVVAERVEYRKRQ